MNDRLEQIRRAEAESHIEAYSTYELFAPGSWLAKPVKTVLDILPLFDGYTEFHALDLGCGIGRNSIPAAQHFKDIPCRVDCVDILKLAVEKLNENAAQYGVADAINGAVSSIEDYTITPGKYDLIMAISALEHIRSEDAFRTKLLEIRDGLRQGGVACLIVNTGVRECDKETGEELQPQFEVNLPTDEMRTIMEQTFSGWQVVKHTVVHQKYDIPRRSIVSDLETDVLTWVLRKG